MRGAFVVQRGLRHRAALATGLLLVALALGGFTATPAPAATANSPNVYVTVPDNTEGEVLSGVIGFGSTVLGGLLAWIVGVRTEWMRQRFAATTWQDERTLQLGDAVVAFAEAFGNELNAADPQVQLKSHLDTEKAVARVLASARPVRRRDLVEAAKALVEIRKPVRRLPTVTDRGAAVDRDLKPALTTFLTALTTMTADESKAA